MHVNELDEPIDTTVLETTEQEQANQYILPDDVVLEVGGRYGTVSTVIQKKLVKGENHVVIEPDDVVLSALYKNRKHNGGKYHVYTGILATDKTKNRLIKDGYSSRIDATVTLTEFPSSITEVLNYEEFLERYPLKFNVLIADCEGCFETILEAIGHHINDFRLVMVEEDQSHICDYSKTNAYLLKNDFLLTTDGFRKVYHKKIPSFWQKHGKLLLIIILIFYLLMIAMLSWRRYR